MQIKLTEYGLIAEKYIKSMRNDKYKIIIDAYVIMPDHVHMIIFVEDYNGKPNMINHHGISNMINHHGTPVMSIRIFVGTDVLGCPFADRRNIACDCLFTNTLPTTQCGGYTDENIQKIILLT